VVIQFLLQIAQNTGSTRLSLRKSHEESKVRHCRREALHDLAETKLASSEWYIPSVEEQIHHLTD
jgi:hypothetical protein